MACRKMILRVYVLHYQGTYLHSVQSVEITHKTTSSITVSLKTATERTQHLLFLLPLPSFPKARAPQVSTQYAPVGKRKERKLLRIYVASDRSVWAKAHRILSYIDLSKNTRIAGHQSRNHAHNYKTNHHFCILNTRYRAEHLRWHVLNLNTTPKHMTMSSPAEATSLDQRLFKNTRTKRNWTIHGHN